MSVLRRNPVYLYIYLPKRTFPRLNTNTFVYFDLFYLLDSLPRPHEHCSQVRDLDGRDGVARDAREQ